MLKVNLVILCSVFFARIEGHVITKFSHLEEFAAELLKSQEYRWDNFVELPPLFEATPRINYESEFSPVVFKKQFKKTPEYQAKQHVHCESLRNARIFEMVPRNATVSIYSHERKHIISNSLLSEEQKVLKTGYIERRIVIGQEKFKKFCFICLTQDGYYKWAVMHDSVLQTSLLLEKSLFTGISSQKFMAIVDVKATIQGTPLRRMELYFKKSAKKASVSGGESLCHLEKNLQFRICVLCADQLHSTMGPSLPTSRQMGNKTEYFETTSNYFFEQDTFTEICPTEMVELQSTGLKIELELLYCNVSIAGVSHQFYLTRELQAAYSTPRVFLFTKDHPEDSVLTLKYDLYVPVLKFAEKMNHLLIDISRRTPKPPKITKNNSTLSQYYSSCFS